MKRLSAVLAATLILVSCGHTHTIHIPPGVVSKDKKGETVRGHALINAPWLFSEKVDACSKAWLIPKKVEWKDYDELMGDLFCNKCEGSLYTGILHTTPLFSIQGDHGEFTTECDGATGKFSFQNIPKGKYYVVVQGFWFAYMKSIEVPKEDDIDFDGKFPLFSNYFVGLVLMAVGSAATAYLADITD